jgi:hypothetical protein
MTAAKTVLVGPQHKSLQQRHLRRGHQWFRKGLSCRGERGKGTRQGFRVEHRGGVGSYRRPMVHSPDARRRVASMTRCAFVAPPPGSVRVDHGARCRSSTANVPRSSPLVCSQAHGRTLWLTWATMHELDHHACTPLPLKVAASAAKLPCQLGISFYPPIESCTFSGCC